jgi:hypothetical protein
MADLRDFTGKNRKFTGTIGERISTGTTAQRDDSTFGSGTLRFNSSTNLMEYYSGTEWKSIDAPPSIAFVTVDGGADTTSGQVDNEASGNVTIQVKGTLFDTTGGIITFVGTSETLTPVTLTRNSSSLFTCVLPASSFDTPNSPYTVKITNGSGLFAELVNGISADQVAPAFITSAGSLGTIENYSRSSYSLSTAAATDADGDTITYSISAGSLPAGLSLNASTAAITGTASTVASNTTSTFTVSAATTASTSTRQFSITVNAPVVTTFTSSGTFTVPAGLTAVDVLVVGGGGGTGARHAGGGGAGGLIYRPAFPISPATPIAVTVGAGGPGQSSNGEDSVFSNLVAKGGGYGNDGQAGRPGGSGAGGAHNSTAAGNATQPSQPGDSGTYGFGFAGGSGYYGGPPTGAQGGGGGGAGGAGGNSGPNDGADGGIGRVYNISGSPTYYAGGGAGGNHQNASDAGSGGLGGGGNRPPGGPGTNGNSGTNGLGGGGGGGNDVNQVSNGGNGVVIVSY